MQTSRFELAAPIGHPLTKPKELRLRDLIDAPFVWFSRRENPMLYDRMMQECGRGGLKDNKSTLLARFVINVRRLLDTRAGQ